MRNNEHSQDGGRGRERYTHCRRTITQQKTLTGSLEQVMDKQSAANCRSWLGFYFLHQMQVISQNIKKVSQKNQSLFLKCYFKTVFGLCLDHSFVLFFCSVGFTQLHCTVVRVSVSAGSKRKRKKQTNKPLLIHFHQRL